MQQVQASEGMPALIQVGQSVPLTSSQTDSYGDCSSQTQYRNVTQGFYVTASVTGDIVHLAISTNHDRMSQERPDVVNVQSTDTTVSGRLGEWITWPA
jgi:type II secretory pathway component GspD/PulD (secretin)